MKWLFLSFDLFRNSINLLKRQFFASLSFFERVLFLFVILLSLSSCASFKQNTQPSDTTYIKSLEKNLKKTEKDLKTSEKKVSDLKREIALIQLRAIEKQVQNYKSEQERFSLTDQPVDPALFVQERSQLFSIIEAHPHLAATAQGVLDQILTMITHLNNYR